MGQPSVAQLRAVPQGTTQLRDANALRWLNTLSLLTKHWGRHVLALMGTYFLKQCVFLHFLSFLFLFCSFATMKAKSTTERHQTCGAQTSLSQLKILEGSRISVSRLCRSSKFLTQEHFPSPFLCKPGESPLCFPKQFLSTNPLSDAISCL